MLASTRESPWWSASYKWRPGLRPPRSPELTVEYRCQYVSRVSAEGGPQSNARAPVCLYRQEKEFLLTETASV